MTNKLNNQEALYIAEARIQAAQRYLTNAKGEIYIAGKVVTAASIIAAYQADIAARHAVEAAALAHRFAVLARNKTSAQLAPIDAGLQAWVLSRFGAKSDEARAFGFGARKVTVPSIETKAEAVRKRAATRAARGTLGKRQKLKLQKTATSPSTTGPSGVKSG